MEKPTMGQITEIARLISQHNMTRQKLQDLLQKGLLSDLFATTDYPTVDREAFRAALFQGVEFDTYKVLVDYSKSLAEMISAGMYDSANINIVAEHVTHIARDQSLSDDAARSQKEVEICLVRPGRAISTSVALFEIEKRNLFPATLPELLALGAMCPDLQRKHPLVALGSACAGSRRHVEFPILSGGAEKRTLDLSWDGPYNQWGIEVCLVAVRR